MTTLANSDDQGVMTGSSSISVVFLLQRPETWLNVSQIWRLMQRDPRFDPSLWVLPYDVNRPTESETAYAKWHALLTEEELPYQTWESEADCSVAGFDVVIFTVPYDRERPSELHFDRVAATVPHTVYVPYGLPMGGGSQNQQLQFAQPTQVGATAVFVRSHYDKLMYRRYCPSGDSHVHVLGHPRFDNLADIDRFPVDPALTDAIGGRIPILWNSHFSFATRDTGLWNYSTLDRVGGGLLAFAAENQDVALIWRPHPRVLGGLVSEGLLAQEAIEALRKELRSAGIVLDERVDYRHAFAASDALITDLGSFLVEYLATGKPILYLHNPDGPGLNEEGTELVRHLVTAETVEEVIAFIQELTVPSDLTSRINKARSLFLPYQDGRSSKRIVDYISDMVHGKTAVPSISIVDYPVLASFTAGLTELRQKREARRRKLKGKAGEKLRLSRQVVAQAIRSRPRMLRVVDGVLRLFGRSGS